jgi:hypothetical protein
VWALSMIMSLEFVKPTGTYIGFNFFFSHQDTVISTAVGNHIGSPWRAKLIHFLFFTELKSRLKIFKSNLRIWSWKIKNVSEIIIKIWNSKIYMFAQGINSMGHFMGSLILMRSPFGLVLLVYSQYIQYVFFYLRNENCHLGNNGQ